MPPNLWSLVKSIVNNKADNKEVLDFVNESLSLKVEEHHEEEEYHLTQLFEVAVEIINSVAGIIILIALAFAGLNLILVAVNSLSGSSLCMVDPLHDQDKATLIRIRQTLGEQTALALAILVAADVLDTVMKPAHAYDLTDVIKMGFVTVLRTGLAYFLAQEIKEMHEETAMSSISANHLALASNQIASNNDIACHNGSDDGLYIESDEEYLTNPAQHSPQHLHLHHSQSGHLNHSHSRSHMKNSNPRLSRSAGAPVDPHSHQRLRRRNVKRPPQPSSPGSSQAYESSKQQYRDIREYSMSYHTNEGGRAQTGRFGEVGNRGVHAHTESSGEVYEGRVFNKELADAYTTESWRAKNVVVEDEEGEGEGEGEGDRFDGQTSLSRPTSHSLASSIPLSTSHSLPPLVPLLPSPVTSSDSVSTNTNTNSVSSDGSGKGGSMEVLTGPVPKNKNI